MSDEVLSLDMQEVLKMLPHRYPFLLVDRITECVAGKYSKGFKNFTFNEEFFQGHFPGNPIVPGVILIEAMAQASAPALLAKPEFRGMLALFAGLEKVRFKHPVVPGDRFEMEAHLTKQKGPVAKCEAKGYVDGKLCVEAEITVVLK